MSNTNRFEATFGLSYNNGPKLQSQFQVCIFNNKLEIKSEILNENDSEISIIYFNYIIMVRYNALSESLFISLYPHCKLSLTKNNCVNIINLCLYDVTKIGLTTLNPILFKSLLPINDLVSPGEISLFLFSDIQINKEPISKCKAYLYKHELFVLFPLDLKFDLSTTECLSLSNDKMSILIALPNYDITIKLSDNGQLIYDCFDETSKIQLLSLNDERTILKLDELIKFIFAYGLRSEGVFRKCGSQQNIERLFSLVIQKSEVSKIKPDDFKVDDVTSFLKKCVQSYLSGPLIPENIFLKLKSASVLKNQEKMVTGVKSSLNWLPDENRKILRKIYELLYLISLMTEENNMNSQNLSVSTAPSFISKNLDNIRDSITISKTFIDHFFEIFDYSNEEQRRLEIVSEKLKTLPTQLTVRRQFLFTVSLKPFLRLKAEQCDTKIDKDDNFLTGSLCIQLTGTIGDLFAGVFLANCPVSVDVWHMVSGKSMWLKRLLYRVDGMDDTIINGWKYPAEIVPGKGENWFVCREKDKDGEVKVGGTCYQCSVKVTNAREVFTDLRAVLTMPNSLQCFDKKTECEVQQLRLTDLKLYRAHNSKSTVMYLIKADGVVFCWKFSNIVEYREFLFYFDKFRSGRTS